MAAIEPVVGHKYRYSLLTGAPHDPYIGEETGIFVKQISDGANTVYVFASKDRIRRFGNAEFTSYYVLTYVLINNQTNIRADLGISEEDPDFKLLLSAIESPEFQHPPMNFVSLYPTKSVRISELEKILKYNVKRNTVKQFLGEVLYSPPITNNTGKVVFSGGPMYKRSMKNFTNLQSKISNMGNPAGGKRTRKSKKTKKSKKSKKSRKTH